MKMHETYEIVTFFDGTEEHIEKETLAGAILHMVSLINRNIERTDGEIQINDLDTNELIGTWTFGGG